MKTLILTFVMLAICGSAETNISIVGEYQMSPNPATTDPALPGMVSSITVNTNVYILTVDGQWFWGDPEFTWQDWTPHWFESVSITGIASEHIDLRGEAYLELEVSDAVPVAPSLQSITISNEICSISIAGLIAGTTNSIEKSSDLSATNWEHVVNLTLLPDDFALPASTNWTDSTGPVTTNAFYRIIRHY